VTRLENLIEQTAFLLEKQKEAQKDCKEIFQDLLAVIKAKLEKGRNDDEEVAALEKAFSLIEQQASHLTQEAQLDIDFLTEQTEVLKKIQDVKDPAAAREMLAMLIDEDEEVKELASFKDEVNEEAVASRQNLVAMVSDIKEAIQEGSSQEVATYLESILDFNEMDEDADHDEDDCEDDDCCDDEEEEDGCCGSGGGCGDCSGGCSTGGCSTEKDSTAGVDIFASLKEYEAKKNETSDEGTRH
jgi:hypothetical protein